MAKKTESTSIETALQQVVETIGGTPREGQIEMATAVSKCAGGILWLRKLKARCLRDKRELTSRRGHKELWL